MKTSSSSPRRFVLLFGLVALFWIPPGGHLEGAVIYNELFATGNTGNATIGTAGWNGYAGAGAVDLTAVANQGVASQDRVGIGYLNASRREYAFSSNGATTNQIFAMTSSGSAFSSLLTIGSLNVADITSISWKQGNSSTVPEVRLMLQIDGGDWYASDTAFANTGSYTGDGFFTSASADLNKSLAFSSAASGWREVTLEPGTELSLGAAPASALSGLVTGIGFYVLHGATGQTVRLDILTIDAVPEPSANLVFLFGLGLWVMLRRAPRRNA